MPLTSSSLGTFREVQQVGPAEWSKLQLACDWRVWSKLGARSKVYPHHSRLESIGMHAVRYARCSVYEL